MKFIYIKDYLQGEKNSRKSNQRNKCIKNIIGFKKLKIKIIKKRKKMEEERKRQGWGGELNRTAKAQCRGRGL